MKKLFSGLMLFFALSAAQAGDYFRSVDGAGNVSYGDRPLGNATVEKRTPQVAPKPNSALPYQTQRAHDKFPVILYTAEHCEACQQARDYLTQRGIPFNEKFLVTPEEIVQYKKDSHANQVPGLTVGTEWLVGYLESQWRDKLDAAGYPATAPYTARPPQNK